MPFLFLICLLPQICLVHFQILSPDTNSRFIPTMKTFHLLLFLSHFLFLMTTHATLTSAKSQIVDCTMCTSCDNPCQPNPSPPPPTPSPPPPATTTTPACPPPPRSSGSGGGGPYYYYPPPSQSGSYLPPPSSSGSGGYYYPPPKSGGNYNPYTPPPNPIVPYFPFYYHSPPQQSVVSAGSDVKVKLSYGFSLVLIFALYL